MKKRMIAVILTVVMILSMTACGKKDTTNTKTDTADTKSTTETANTADNSGDDTSAGKTFKIGMVTDVGGVNDGSFNQSSWEGLQKSSSELGVEVKYLE